MSDRDKGLLSAKKQEIPNAHLAFCCWHLAENVKKHYGTKARDAFWKLVYVQVMHNGMLHLLNFMKLVARYVLAF